MMRNKKVPCVLFLFLTISFSLIAETDYFRVNKVHNVAIPADDTDIPVIQAAYNDGVCVTFPTDSTFIQALEFQIAIPKNVLLFRDFLGYAVYSNIKPQSDAPNTIDFSGVRQTLQPFPSKLITAIQLPVTKAGKTKNTPYTTVVNTLFSTDYPVFLRLLPIMKGLPDNVSDFVFEIKVKPILINKGKLIVTLKYPPSEMEHSPVTISIDDAVANESDNLIDTGMHHVSVVSENYRTAVRSVSVSQGKTTELEIELQDTIPMMQLVAPENAVIMLDGEPVGEEMLRTMVKIAPGEHVINFTIGDYEIQRTILIEKAKNYSVSLLVDVEISVTQ